MAPQDPSTLRLYSMRLLFFLNFVGLGLDVWPALLRHEGPWDPVKGVAYSFWAALSALSALGLRHPVKMLPLLLLQLVYKVVWLSVIAPPMWPAVQSTGLFKAMALGVVFDVLAIPWAYVVAAYLRQPGDRWRSLGSKTG